MLNNIQNGWRRRTTKIVLILGIIYLIYTINFSNIAESVLIDSIWQCADTSEIKTSLESNGERAAFAGKIGENELIFTLWYNRNGDWSVLATPIAHPNISCMIIYGTGFNDMRPKTII